MNTHMAVLGMAGHLIRRLHQQSTQLFSQRTQVAGFEVTPVQFAALDAIQAHPGVDQSQVAELIGYDRATIGGVIDRLEKKDWVIRVIAPNDRRARALRLSPEGSRVFKELVPIVRKLQKDILHPLSAQEQRLFIALTQRALRLPSEH
ncbi:MAG: HTH-type transcriptional repressor NicR [Pseudomonadota bacterium]|jgi:DNA-binding MarR family transcriptional regulator